MAVDPNNLDITTIPDLPNGAFSLLNYIAQSNPAGLMTKGTQADFATFISPYVAAVGGSGFVPVSTNVLPTPAGSNSYSIVTNGTYTQSGQPNLVVNGNFNIISWDGTNWDLIEEINLNLSNYPTLDQAALKVNIPEDTIQEIGIQNAGPDSDNTNSFEVYKTNTACISPINGFVLELVLYIQTPGTFYASIIEPFDGGCFVIETLPMFTETGTGYKGYAVNKPIKKGQALALGGGVGTATIAFNTSGAVSTNRLVQYRVSGNPIYLGAGSFYTLFYTIKEFLSTGLDDFITAKTLPLELDKLATTENISDKSIPVGYKGSYSSTLAISNQQIITTDQLAAFNGIAKVIELNMDQAGTITFSIGLLDQNNFWVEDRSLTATVAVGLNQLTLNIELLKGQRIAIKGPMPTIRVKTGYGAYWKSTSVGYGSALQRITTSTIVFGYDLFEIYETPFAKVSDLNALESEIDSLKEKTALVRSFPSGFKFRLVCDDDGANLRAEATGSTMAVLGNSITQHPITSYWWGVWGMAASERSKDFVHVLETRMKLSEPSATVTPLNIAAWEQDRTTFNLSTINSTISGKDYIVIRLGENVSDLTNYQSDIEALINHCKTVNPTATILTTGNFWSSTPKDNIMKAAALSTGAQYIDLTGLDTPENESYIGAIVKGDDGFNHTVDNSGVAIHPGDLGMQRIADRIFNAIF